MKGKGGPLGMPLQVSGKRKRKPVVQCSLGEWKAICSRMKSCVPAPEGYSWRFVWSVKVGEEGKRGDCERREPKEGRSNGVMVVRVMKGMSETETEDVLIHEVAHAFDKWEHHSWQGDHSGTFYIWLGRIERRYRGQETG